MDYKAIEDCISIILASAILFHFGFRNIAVSAIEETGTNSYLYPKHFIVPKRWIKKFFKIKDRVIPKYLYFELYLSLFFLIYAMVSIAISIAFNGSKIVSEILIAIIYGLEITGLILNAVMSLIFKKNKINKTK